MEFDSRPWVKSLVALSILAADFGVDQFRKLKAILNNKILALDQTEMVATLKELEDGMVPLDKRDYCAHYYLKWKKCFREEWPWGKRKCKHEMHEYSDCQLDDFLLRKKEYERERRLRERELKKQQKQGVETEIM